MTVFCRAMALRGQFGRLRPFRGESEHSGFVFGEDAAVDHAFELRAGAFDVFRRGFDAECEADALRPHPGGCGGEDFQDLLVGGAGEGRVVGGELGGGERAQGGAGGRQGGQFAVDAAEFGGKCGDLLA
ncbi:hypothetical protein [Micromonospora sp. LOL_021]|uniref:hypothetical protein n=1 Tax=Micromonospora sp. LOL_021 TaxID=3345417 RepID=UPI003A895FE9